MHFATNLPITTIIESNDLSLNQMDIFINFEVLITTKNSIDKLSKKQQ